MPRPPLSSRRVWALPLICVIGAAGLAFGCAQVLGVDEEYALSPSETTPDAADASPPLVFVDAADAVAELPDAGDPDACAPTQKRCNGVCVPKSEPKYGCGSADCSPCSLPQAETTACTVDNLCKAGTCVLGFTVCGSVTAGCTTDLSQPNTCGGCLVSCQGGEVCNPGGCSTVCDPGLTKCGQSCVNTTTSPLHCGPTGADNGPSCANICPTQPNGDPACVSGSCIIACRPGFSHCDGTVTGPCVQQTLFYRDADSDGWGDTAVSKFACSAALAGIGWVDKPGDCHDMNRDVNPGQTRYMEFPYVTRNGLSSFDWNCDGIEMEVPTVVHFKPCTGECNELGVAPAPESRQGAGVNPYCGSKSELTCVKTGVTPTEPGQSFGLSFGVTPLSDELIQCGVVNKEIPANPCR